MEHVAEDNTFPEKNYSECDKIFQYVARMAFWENILDCFGEKILKEIGGDAK